MCRSKSNFPEYYDNFCNIRKFCLNIYFFLNKIHSNDTYRVTNLSQ